MLNNRWFMGKKMMHEFIEISDVKRQKG